MVESVFGNLGSKRRGSPPKAEVRERPERLTADVPKSLMKRLALASVQEEMTRKAIVVEALDGWLSGRGY